MTSDRTDPVIEAVAVLRSGGVIALPTDTLYALSCDARDAEAVRRVYRIKGREDGKPLPLFVTNLHAAESLALFNETARLLAHRFWPGQLTIVLPRHPDFDSEALAGGETVALRVPDHPIALAVLAALDAPLTGTSANRSGGPDPVSADDVRAQLGGDIDYVLDDGPCAVGLSSTIVDCTGAEPRILRAGAISEFEINEALLISQLEPRS